MQTVRKLNGLYIYHIQYYFLKFHLTHSFDGDTKKNVGLGKQIFVWELLLSKLFLFQKVNFDLYLH